MSADEHAIRDLVDRWMRATADGDADTVLNLMADDVIFMVPGRAPFGKEEFRAQAQGLKNVRIEGQSDIRELKVLGAWAYLRNHITVTMTAPGKDAVTRQGWTLTVLRKENGRWLLARDANLVG
jgi:uncharacterized protein (TIGR02246 family)